MRLFGSPLLAVVAVLAMIGGLRAKAQTPVFPQTQTYTFSPPSTPRAFAVTDLNNDKKPDLVFLGATAVYAILDITNPASTPQVTGFTCSTSASGSLEDETPVIADVNHDGKPDVVFICEDYIAVMTGKGDGTFQSPAYYAVNSLSPVVVADLNGDGYPDLIVTTLSSNSTAQLSVLPNKGAAAPGIFGTAVNYPSGVTGNGLGPLSTGDFNGDGKQDVVALATASGANGTTILGYTVFLGNGDGTLQVGETAATHGGGVFATGDFNGDGITDLVFVNQDQNGNPLGAQTLFGSTNGTFTTGPTLPLAGSYITTAVLTSSGALDIVTSSPSTVVYHGDGKGNFSQTGDYAAAGVPFAYDVNNTGTPDLLLVGGPLLTILDLPGNGDGTFVGIPATPLSSALVADVNGDGLADLVALSSLNNQQTVATWIGRGNGTFVALNPTIPSPGNVLVTGDFNSDGKIDIAALTAGIGVGHAITTSEQDSELYFQTGNGNGTFQAAGTGVDLGVIGANGGITGDFNKDGKLDIVVTYNNVYGSANSVTPVSGLVFVPGNGDGTFGVPVNFAQFGTPPILVGDLNKDGNPDLVISGTVFLGNGDGTFKQIPLNINSTQIESLLVLADVNGDGFADLVVSSTNSGQGAASVYLGNGDGTFQTTPDFTYSPTPFVSIDSAAVGDVNGDGHPDLVVYYTTPGGTSNVEVAYGDGMGGFKNDPNTYFAGSFHSQLILTRVNNQAPAANSDNKLDALLIGGTITTLLNTNNATPAVPGVFAASVNLKTSTNTANENQNVTLTATVTGLTPTGTVTFTAGGTSLGSAPVMNGVAKLTTEFAAAGTYTITSNYAGDANNSAALSNGVTVTVTAPIPPDFTITSNQQSTSLMPGQSATFTLSITPSGGYAGTVKFSCGSLPSEVTCTFTPSSVTPANGTAATTTLSIATTAAVASATPVQPNRSPWTPGVISLAGLLGLVWSKRARTRISVWASGAGYMMLLAAVLLIAGGCSGSSSSGNGSGPSNPGTPNLGTPAGSYSIVVTAADSASGPTHSMTLSVMVQ